MSSNLNWICGWKYGEISRARFELIGNLQDRELYLGQHSQTKCFNYQLHQNLSFCFYCQAPTAIANFQLPSFRLRQGVPSNISAQEVYITSSYYDIESVSLSPFTDVCHARKVFANNVGGTFSVFHRVPLKAHGPLSIPRTDWRLIWLCQGNILRVLLQGGEWFTLLVLWGTEYSVCFLKCMTKGFLILLSAVKKSWHLSMAIPIKDLEDWSSWIWILLDT